MIWLEFIGGIYYIDFNMEYYCIETEYGITDINKANRLLGVLQKSMADKELRKLSREDLLKMLVNQSREVKRLKQDRDNLISQLRYFRNEFDKVGSLDAIISRLGIPSFNSEPDHESSALEELLRYFEEEETTLEVFEKDDEQNTSEKAKESAPRNKRKRFIKGGIAKTEVALAESMEYGFIDEDYSVQAGDEDTKDKMVSDTPEYSGGEEAFSATDSDFREPNKKNFDKSKAKMNRLQEAVAWAKIRFGDKK